MYTIEDENIRRETSYWQMSNELCKALTEYLKDHNLTFSKYCKDLKVEEYMMRKIVDRKIGMYAPYRLLVKIAKSIDQQGIKLWQEPFQLKSKK